MLSVVNFIRKKGHSFYHLNRTAWGTSFRYLKNRIKILFGAKIENSKYWNIHKIIPLKSLDENYNRLLRVGGGADGSYILAQPLSEAPVAYSVGIDTNILWDKDMADRGYDVYQYDHTIDALPEENEHFHWKKLGLTGEDETNELKTLSTLLKDNGHQNKSGMILKMDIEGCEWAVFANASEETLCQFDQIVLELHYLLDINTDKYMLKALQNLSKNHVLVHIHANNCAPADIYGKMITPTFAEATFVLKDKYHFTDQKVILPRNIDLKNSPHFPEIPLGDWNVK